jgi:hypothetical protein
VAEVAVVQLLAAVAAGVEAALLVLQRTLVPAWSLISGALCVQCWGCAWCGCHLSSGARAWLPSCWMLQGALRAAAAVLLCWMAYLLLNFLCQPHLRWTLHAACDASCKTMICLYAACCKQDFSFAVLAEAEADW